MIFINTLNGFDNEYQFVKKLNGKKVKELDSLLRNVVDDLFLNVDEEAHISCWRNHYKQKSDIFIKINGVMKGISIKKGAKNSVHVESVSEFIQFLKQCGLDEEIISEYLKYHYADGTTDGSGSERMSAVEYKVNNQDYINKINIAFNNESVINNAIKRFVIKGNNSKFYIAGIIYGEVDDFLWINKDDIVNIILSKIDKSSSAIHFGPLVCQPKARCLNNNPKYESDRYYIQIKWYSLFDDIIENMNKKEQQIRVV